MCGREVCLALQFAHGVWRQSPKARRRLGSVALSFCSTGREEDDGFWPIRRRNLTSASWPKSELAEVKIGRSRPRSVVKVQFRGEGELQILVVASAMEVSFFHRCPDEVLEDKKS